MLYADDMPSPMFRRCHFIIAEAAARRRHVTLFYATLHADARLPLERAVLPS